MKNRILPLFVAAAITVTSVPIYAADDYIESGDEKTEYSEDESKAEKNTRSSSVIEVDGTEKTLAAAVLDAEYGKETTIKLKEDIVVSSQIDIPEGKNIVFDMNGMTVTVEETFAGRIFRNYGTLIIEGDGTIDVSDAGANGYGSVNNYGYLEVVDGKYIGLKEANASNFYNRKGGTAIFHNPDIDGGAGCVASEADTETYIYGGKYFDEYYPAIENRGYMEITAGEFINTSCSACFGGKWGYTVRSGESSDSAYLLIKGETDDSIKVTGTQGGLCVIGGTADIYNGTYEIVDCKKGHGSTFYAGYFSGESYVNSTNIYGGTFKSFNKVAIQVGNGNSAPDSGNGEESTLVIYDGTFIGGNGADAVYVEEKKNAIGNLKVVNGNFSSEVDEKYIDEGSSFVKNDDGTWSAETVFDSGSGTEEDPYKIDSAKQLKEFRDLVNSGKTFEGKYIELTDDIDLEGEEWTPIGGDTLYTGGNYFSGSFDGGGHTIYGLKITETYDSSDYQYSAYGLFGAAGKGAEFKNLNIESPYIKLDQAKNTGALLGGIAYAGNGKLVKISNVNVTNAEISANARVGGIVGWVIDSIKGVEISDCTVTGDISAVYNTVVNDDGDKAGGIAGQASSDCFISNCTYSDGTVSAFREAAGILGTSTSGSIAVTGSSVADATIIQDKTVSVSSDPKCGQLIGRVGDNEIVIGGNDFSDNVTLISDNKPENGVGSDGAGLEIMTIKVGKEYYATLEDAFKDIADMSGDVEIELIGDLDISGENTSFDLSDSDVESITICSAKGVDASIISGVDGNNIIGPVYCPSINIELPEGASLTVKGLTFHDDLSFDSENGEILIEDCVFNGSISDYPTADRIEFRNNVFEFDGTAANFYTNNAFPVWYKVENDMEFIFENNTVKGPRGVHIETSRGNVDMTVDYNHFELKDSEYENKAIAFQVVGMINGDVSFSNNYVDAYMGICFFKGIKWVDGSSLDIDNNYLKGDCKLYGSSEWNAEGTTEKEKEENADKFAAEFIKNDGVKVDAEHKHKYEDGVCIICGHKKNESSGSSSSSGISLPEVDRDDKTEVTENPDGSVTERVENSDGSITETTKYTDGSKRVVNTEKDGKVTTTLVDAYGNYTETVEDTDGSKIIIIKNTDGSESKTVIDKYGRIKAEAMVPDEKIEEETEKNGYVSLPMPVIPVTKDRANAPVITVDLSGKTAVVEIPVVNGGMGTVIIKVADDGSEEIVRTSAFTGKGVTAELSDGDVVKVVDNSKDFADVSDSYWGADAIDFVTSREIFSGMTEDMFAPDGTMTRAMIWTVLARIDGQDVSSSSGIWYEGGQKWAVENGISDGTAPNDAITREQLASMLYRYAQMKGEVTADMADLSRFADNGEISTYAVEALQWAVAEGIISGDNGMLSPYGNATRAQAAMMIMKFCER